MLLAALLAACASEPGETSRPSRSHAASDATVTRGTVEDRVTVQEAARFAGIVLPTNVESIGAYERRGIDRLMAFAVRLPQKEVAAVLRDSDFAAELRPGLGVQYEAVEGVRLSDESSVWSAQDERRVEGKDVFRDLVVLNEQGDRSVLHVWAYTA